MDKLPQEVLQIIVDLLLQESVPDYHRPTEAQRRRYFIAPLSTVCKSWRAPVERHNFRQLHISNLDVQVFGKIVKADRIKWLKSLRFTVLLPTYDDTACGHYERMHERIKNNEVFTHAFHDLLQVLAINFAGRKASKGLNLELSSIHSPSDVAHISSPENFRRQMRYADGQPDLREERYAHFRVSLLDTVELPTVDCVEMFEVQMGSLSGSRQACIGSLFDIAASFSNLKEIHWVLADSSSRFASHESQCTARTAAAKAILRIRLPSLRHIFLVLETRCPRNLLAPIANFVPPGGSHDPLSAAVHTLARNNLTSLGISGVVDSSLFWPSEIPTGTAAIGTAPWPCLQYLDVEFSPMTPKGDWYFLPKIDHLAIMQYVRPENPSIERRPDPLDLDAPDEIDQAQLDIEDMESERTVARYVPNWPLLTPLIRAFAMAARHMTAIRAATLKTYNLTDSEDSDEDVEPFIISYYAPGEPVDILVTNPLWVQDRTQRRLLLRMIDWDLPDEALEPLRRIGEHQGYQLVEKKLRYRYLRYP